MMAHLYNGFTAAIKKIEEPGVVVHTCNPSTQKTGSRRV
jgi:hypothetical protein